MTVSHASVCLPCSSCVSIAEISIRRLAIIIQMQITPSLLQFLAVRCALICLRCGLLWPAVVRCGIHTLPMSQTHQTQPHKTHITHRVSVNTTSAPSAHRRTVFVDCHSRRLGIDRQCTHSLHRNDMAYCHFELCRDCGLGCFSQLLLADTLRLSVLVFLYQITVFLQQNTAASLLELYFNDSMQTVYACGGGGGSQQRGRRWGQWGRCSI